MRSTITKLTCICLMLAINFIYSQKVEAIMVDLTTSNSGTIGGATFVFDQQQPSGTGVLNPFLRIQNNVEEQGYNTTQANQGLMPFDAKHGFTSDLAFSTLQASSGEYLFVLDIGESVNKTQSLLSLDGLKFFVTSTPGQNSSTVDSAGNASGIDGTLLYDMDAVADSYVLLDANRDGNPGNGVSDMLLKIPESVFSSVGANDYIILWSRFGLQEGFYAGTESSGTFEEWAHITVEDDNGGGGGGGNPVVPEPGTLLLLGSGLFGLAIYGRRKMVK